MNKVFNENLIDDGGGSNDGEVVGSFSKTTKEFGIETIGQMDVQERDSDIPTTTVMPRKSTIVDYVISKHDNHPHEIGDVAITIKTWLTSIQRLYAMNSQTPNL